MIAPQFWGAQVARIYPAYLLAFAIALPIAIYSNEDGGLGALVTATFHCSSR